MSYDRSDSPDLREEMARRVREEEWARLVWEENPAWMVEACIQRLARVANQ